MDNFGERADLILLFKEYFESKRYMKTWFNYGFDRHMFYNHGIDVRGFAGDAMHMARLADPTRGPQEYSLSNLSGFYARDIMAIKVKILDALKNNPSLTESQKNTIKVYEKNFVHQTAVKTKLKNLFRRQKVLKNGELGKTFEVPMMEELHTSSTEIESWVHYSTLDAESTYYLREILITELRKFKVDFEGMKNLFDLYCKYWLPFGEVLTELERNGIRVNKEHLARAEKNALEDIVALQEGFKQWVLKIRPDLDEFNPSSTQQLQQLLYAPFKRSHPVKKTQSEHDGSENDDFMNDFDKAELEMAGRELKETVAGVKAPRNIDTDMEFPLVREFKVPNTKVVSCNEGIIEEGQKKPLAQRVMRIEGLGIKPPLNTASGLPSVDVQSLQMLAGNVEKGKFGAAYDHFQ